MASAEEKNNFAGIIEGLVITKNLNYLEAMMFYCEQSGMEIETAATLVNERLKGLIEKVARDFNYLKKEGTDLGV